jgi:xanthine dehydrogenase accessory factor
MAAQVGFDVVLCDDNDTGALDELGRPPWAGQVVESFDIRDIEADIGPVGPGDHALIMTRDHAVDQAILEALLPKPSLTYLGLIGSRGKIGRFRKRIAAKGHFDESGWARLHAPIGLDIGAETPEEIAVAVVAELIATRRRGQP